MFLVTFSIICVAFLCWHVVRENAKPYNALEDRLSQAQTLEEVEWIQRNWDSKAKGPWNYR